MCVDSGPDGTSREETTPEGSRDETSAKPACPLSVRQQNRNLVRFAVHMSLIYLAAPVVYVGNLDAILLNKLGYSDKVANLPAAAFIWTTAPFLVLFTWYFCHVRMLKPVLVASYAVSAAAGLIVVVGLLQPQSNWLVVALVVHAMLIGLVAGNRQPLRMGDSRPRRRGTAARLGSEPRLRSGTAHGRASAPSARNLCSTESLARSAWAGSVFPGISSPCLPPAC